MKSNELLHVTLLISCILYMSLIFYKAYNKYHKRDFNCLEISIYMFFVSNIILYNYVYKKNDVLQHSFYA